MRARPTLLLAAWVLSGCTAAVNVDNYTFDVDPCGHEVTECGPGGEEYTFVIGAGDLPRLTEGRLLDGFDFDGTDATVCRRPDRTSPITGETGIDNQLTSLGELLEQAIMMNIGDLTRQTIIDGDSLQVVQVQGADSLDNDSCVSVRIRQASLLPGQLPESLDVDGDGLLDPDLTLDQGYVSSEDRTGCIIDGVLHARFAGTDVFRFGTGEIEGERLRLRARIRAEGLDEAVLGGSVTVESLAVSFRDGGLDITDLLQSSADLDPDESNQCSSISWALSVSAIPVDIQPSSP